MVYIHMDYLYSILYTANRFCIQTEQNSATQQCIEDGRLLCSVGLSRAQQTATEHGIEGGGLLILC